MNSENNHIKHSMQEDLELVRQSILRSKFRSSDVLQITCSEKYKKEAEEHKKEIVQTQSKLFEKGYQSLLEEIMNHTIEGFYSKDPEIKPIPIENFQIAPDMMEEIKSNLATGNDANIDFSTDVQMLFYENAMNFYEESLYDKAISSFTFLTEINPDIQSFWIGLALSYEKNLNMSQAIDSFEAAIKSETEDFSPFFGLLRCCEAIKDYSKIKYLLEAAKDNEAIKEQAAEVLEYLKTKK